MLQVTFVVKVTRMKVEGRPAWEQNLGIHYVPHNTHKHSCCIPLCCVVLWCVVLHCVVLRCVVFQCVVLRCVALCCVVLCCIVNHVKGSMITDRPISQNS